MASAQTYTINEQVSNIQAYGGDINLDLPAQTVYKPMDMIIGQSEAMELVDGYLPISPEYSLEMMNRRSFNINSKYKVTVSFSSSLPTPKSVYSFDVITWKWQFVEAQIDLANSRATVELSRPYAKLVVLDYDSMVYGKASWYAYKDCMCAASPDYPKGTELLVVNLNKNEAIKVTVNDWGPERDIFPDRVIDLDVVAFTKFASKGTGVLQNIMVLPFKTDPFSPQQTQQLKAGEKIALTQELVAALQPQIKLAVQP